MRARVQGRFRAWRARNCFGAALPAVPRRGGPQGYAPVSLRQTGLKYAAS
jgi:hypothetical protein